MEIPQSAFDWDETDLIEKAKKENEAKAQERAKAYHHVFVQDKSGSRILAEWIQLYCTGGVPSVEATARECAMRDGKQQLIADIITQINIATGLYND